MASDVVGKRASGSSWHGRCLELAGGNGVAARDVGPRVVGIFRGEGIGPEVIDAALGVLDAIEATGRIKLVRQLGGDIGTAVNQDGELDSESADFCSKIFAEKGAVLCGPGGGRFVYDLRRRFDLYCKVAPLRPMAALARASRLKPEVVNGLDILVVRDNAGGVYQGEWTQRESAEGLVAEHRFSYSQSQVERIVRVGARLAKARRGRMDVVLKDGGVPTISALWRTTAERIGREAGIECCCHNVDYAAYLMIQDARRFDVIVTPNLLGDVLADLGAVYLGSRGLSYSANFSASGQAVYQTGHGAAKDLAGTDRANPVGQILSMAMMLRESYGLHDEADLIELAVDSVYAKSIRTDDLVEPRCRVVGTREMGELIAKAVTTLWRSAVPA